MPEKPAFPLYELSAEEFERLCVDLLMADDPNLNISTIESPRWIDAVGTRRTGKESRSLAIEASHRTVFHPEGLQLFLERMSSETRKFDEYIFVTSSPISNAHLKLDKFDTEKALHGEIKVLGREEVITLLTSHPAVASKYFRSVGGRVKRRKVATILSSFAVAISIGGLANALYSFFGSKIEPKSQLSKQVKTVEESIAGLNVLERSLVTLKIDLQQKSEESERVAKEYERAMKLKSLTAEQLEQVKKAINSQGSIDISLNYFLGFLLGVASSVLATVITDRWKQRRALLKPYA